MGRRGPPKTPTELLRLSGSWRANSRPGEPTPPAGRPDAPEWLSPRALEYWHGLVPVLEEMNLLSEADGDALALYVQSLARLAECEEIVTREGLTYTQLAEDGSIRMIRARPEQRMAKELYTTVSRLGQQFGLSPASRAHLDVKPKAPTSSNPKDDFFKVG